MEETIQKTSTLVEIPDFQIRSTIYFPILKAKRGELKALSMLKGETKNSTIPIIELVDGCKANVIKYLSESWSFNGNEIFIDPYIMLTENGFDFKDVNDIFVALQNKGVNAVPVTRINYNDDVFSKIKSLLNSPTRIVVRITQDFTDPIYYEAAIEKVKKTFKCEESDINLILDFSFIEQRTLNQVLDSATTLLDYIKTNDFRSVTIAAGSFIKDLSSIPVDTIISLQRFEWKLWNTLLSKSNRPDLISYSDYATRHPIYEYNAQPYAGSSSIRYTSDTSFIVLRGQLPSIHPDGMGQYHEKCRLLLSHPHYDGALFSLADSTIENCANRLISSGNLETWVKISTARHVDKLASLLA